MTKTNIKEVVDYLNKEGVNEETVGKILRKEYDRGHNDLVDILTDFIDAFSENVPDGPESMEGRP